MTRREFVQVIFGGGLATGSAAKGATDPGVGLDAEPPDVPAAPTRLCQVAFSVRNLPGTYRWYQSILGFRPSGGTRFPGLVASRIQGIDGARSSTEWLMDDQEFRQLEMFEFECPIPKPMRRSQRPNDIGYAILGLHVRDFDYLLKRLGWAGIEVTGPLGMPGSRRASIGFQRLLRDGANYFTSDDHELWNNAPHRAALIRDTWPRVGPSPVVGRARHRALSDLSNERVGESLRGRRAGFLHCRHSARP